MQIAAQELEKGVPSLSEVGGSSGNEPGSSMPEVGTASGLEGESAIGGEVAPAEDPEELGQGSAVYLGVSMRDSREFEKTAKIFYENNRAKGIFFFRTEQLAEQGDFLRKLYARGHRIGLIPQGDTLERKLLDIEEANRLLGHILRTNTAFILADDQRDTTWKGLSDAGYILWRFDISVDGSENSQAVLSQIEAHSGRKVLLNDGVKAAVVSDILRHLQEDQGKVQPPRETSN